MTSYHDAWAAIFDELRIVDEVRRHGYFDISADQIRSISGKEPRNMAKLDFRETLPPVMQEAGYALLAIQNGLYRIGPFNPYLEIGPCVTLPERIEFPKGLLTLDAARLTTESSVLDAALAAGILEKVFGEQVALTIRGRSRYEPFVLNVGSTRLQVEGVQVEVDGGYEGARSVNVVEAKIGARSNINLRQVAYPLLGLDRAVRRRKTVRSFACFFHEGVLRFVPIVQQDDCFVADIRHEQAFMFDIATNEALPAVDPQVAETLARSVPFPQADRLEKVIDMFRVVASEGSLPKSDLQESFDIDPRQIDYYVAALRWLGLVPPEVRCAEIALTEVGKVLARQGHIGLVRWVNARLKEEPIFSHARANGAASIPRLLWEARGVTADSTIRRRTQTVMSWIQYVNRAGGHST